MRRLNPYSKFVESINNIELSGVISKIYPTKYTLQHVPVASFVLLHESYQTENNSNYKVKCRVFCIWMGKLEVPGEYLLDEHVVITGFLCDNAKSQLVLHVKSIKLSKQ